MAQPLQSINLVAPGFKGVNTEDSPIGQDFSFADVADNAVIDKRGRVAARKGIKLLTSVSTPLGSSYANKVHYFYDNAGNDEIFVAGNNKIFKTTTTTTTDDTLTDITPASYTITSDDWKIVNFNDKAYFFQRGYDPLVYDDTNGLRTFTVVNGAATDAKYKCNEAIAAYGRLWIVDTDSDKQTIRWSDLLIGNDFTGGSSGSIDVSKAWPDGYDEVQALVAHNNALIIFGNHSTLVYNNAFSPANMALIDTISGVGCISRNTVQGIGTDVLFMSQTGLRSFGRTIQEKSLPISDLSKNVKSDIIPLIESRTSAISSVYSAENSFYLVTFPDENTTYCFDLKGRLENGSYRATRFSSNTFKSYATKTDGTLLIGTEDGVGTYDGYVDQYNDSGTIKSASYRFRYYSPGLTFNDPSKIKLLKKLRPTIVGANTSSVFLQWSYDFSDTFTTQEFSIGSQVPYYFNEAASEYPVYSELSSYGISSSVVDGVVVVNKYLGEFASAPTTGSGGGAVLNGDSYVNTTDNKYYVYISGEFTDLDTLTPSATSEFTGGSITSRPSINTTGGGTVITIGLEADINGFALSLQEINVLALIGKTL